MCARLSLCVVVFLCGCGTVPPTSQSEPSTGETILVPVPVPVSVPVTNMDVLRASCWYMTDANILNAIAIVDEDWWEGISYSDSLAMNDHVCGFDISCERCWDSVVYFVYVIAH